MTLIITCGLPGVGKTTIARQIAAERDATILRSDVVRKEVFPNPSYSSDETEMVYDELLVRAAEILPEAVVLDATFRRQRHRDMAVALAERLDVDYEIVKVECDEEVVRERIESRTGDASDADFSVYKEVEFEPLTREATIVDNTPEADAPTV